MTPEQYERWKDFALRMARTCFAKHRRPSAAWIEDVVEDFFETRLDQDDVVCISDWDNSTEYPDGHPSRRRQGDRPCGCKYPHGYMNPVPASADCEHCSGTGRRPDWISPRCVGDMLSEFLAEQNGYAPRCKPCSSWRHDGECRCDEIHGKFYEQWDEQWGGPVHCCIRAGLDMASAPSAGVLGFTAGDVRRMYPEGVPAWVFPPDEQLGIWMTDEINGTFAELDDSKGLVL